MFPEGRGITGPVGAPGAQLREATTTKLMVDAQTNVPEASFKMMPAMPLSPLLAFVASKLRAGMVLSGLYELEGGLDT